MYTTDVDSATLIATEQRHELGLFGKRPMAIVRGSGAHLYDAEGRAYIDCIGGQGTANIGHSHPAYVAAVQQQVERLTICTGILANDQRAAYLEALTAALPFPARLFLCNSGAEANEACLKFARILTGRTRIIVAQRGFHGRTMGALSMTWDPKYRTPFEPLIPDITHVPYNDPAALAAAIDDQTAAVMLEPVQGEGGVRPAAPGYLAAARDLCDQHGALLVLDEVQTGFGRTGRMFATEHSGIVPDMLALAKSIGGGIPMGAVAVHTRHGTLPPGSHGTTFGGNPLACAAAHATLRILQDEELPAAAARKGAWLFAQLQTIESPLIREIRGQGLLVGIELKQRVVPYLQALIEHGVLALPAGPNVLRLLPPLVITEADLAHVVAALRDVLSPTR